MGRMHSGRHAIDVTKLNNERSCRFACGLMAGCDTSFDIMHRVHGGLFAHTHKHCILDQTLTQLETARRIWCTE
jgi:hypothetical protein